MVSRRLKAQPIVTTSLLQGPAGTSHHGCTPLHELGLNLITDTQEVIG